MDRLYLDSLNTYKLASTEEQNTIPKIDENYYDFERVEDGYIRRKIKEYVLLTAEKTAIHTTYGYLFSYNRICDFFNDSNPRILLKTSNREEVLSKYKSYLLSRGKPLFKIYTLTHTNTERLYFPHSYYYLNRFLKYVYKEKEDEDKLYTSDFPYMVNNPANPIKYIGLGKIHQIRFRSEVKEAIIFATSHKSAVTIKSEVSAANRFSEYMRKKYPDIKSCAEIKKNHISDFIIYLKVESGYKAKTYYTLIGSLKALLADIGMIYEYGKLESYFSPYEYMKRKQPIQRVYTEYELNRFNKALKTMDEQMARCLILHQLLGTRISDTLLLEKDCIKKKSGKPVILIRQSKVKRFMEKPINGEIERLVNRCISYTEEKYGDTKYVFVSTKNPELPLSYNSLKYWTEEMIRQNDIKDDFGNPLFFGTHVFRRYYGKRLTELHMDDVTISKLLGHRDTQSVNRYRRMGNKQIAEETKPFRNYMNKVIKEISAGW